MRPERWWSVILSMGLFMALAPLSAQAGPNRSFVPQSNRQAFTRPQPRAFTPQMHHQAFNRPQPQTFANGWNGQPHRWQQPQGQAYGWHGQNRQWHQPYGQAYGWNHQRQWHQPYGHHYGWNGHQRQWDHRRAYGWNGQQRQWDYRNAHGWNDHQRQWQPPANGGQHYNPGFSSYNRAGYPAHSQSPSIAPSSSGYSHNHTNPAGQTGVQPISPSEAPATVTSDGRI